MKILKGSKLRVCHFRKGKFQGIALRDFNTNDEWYPIAVAEFVEGCKKDWSEGEEIPCRGTLCSVIVIKESNNES